MEFFTFFKKGNALLLKQMCCCKEGYKCEQAAFLGLGRGADSPEQFRFFTDFILSFAKSGYDDEGCGLTRWRIDTGGLEIFARHR